MPEVKVTCKFRKLHDPETSTVARVIPVEKSTILKGFKSELRYKHQLEGDVVLWNLAPNPTSGKMEWVKITDLTQTVGEVLTHENQLFVMSDPSVTVAGGGYGGGADVRSPTGQPVFAGGGMGKGGVITAGGQVTGGHGFGGDGHGKGIAGQAGVAHGGNANATKPGESATAGDGFAGDLTSQ
jgi:hypothetical protein